MKLRKLLLLSGLGLLVFGSQSVVEATGNSANHETGITVNILERDLSIRKVQVPSFGKHTLTGNEQTVKSSQDLVVRLKDKRLSNDSWRLTYTFHPSEVADEHQQNLVFNVGEGILSEVIEQDGVESFVTHPTENYQAHAIRQNHVGSGTSDILTLHEGDKEKVTMYEYRVAKEDISFEIPAGIKAGEYHGTQVLRLIDAPS